MKNITKYSQLFSFRVVGGLLLASVLVGCELTVLQDPKAFTVDKAQDANGAYQSATGAIKSIFDGHQKMAWAAGFIGNEEIQTVSESAISLTGLRLERENIVAKDNSFNRTIISTTYAGLALADNAREAINKNTFSAKGKALLLANVGMAEGIAYGDMAKFYEGVVEYKTGAKLSPEAAKAKAIAALTDAINQFKAAAAIVDATPERLTGLFVDPVIGQKFCNSFIGMLHFDTGAKAQAGSFLEAGYVAADAGKEIGILNINALTGAGIYPEWRSGVEFQLNGYSQKFIDGRIVGDTLRRAPARWYVPAKGISVDANRVAMNYFFPQSPLTATTPVGGATLAAFPIITWQEVSLMLADPTINKAKVADVMEQVLISWRITAANAKRLATDPTITLDRVARYEYVGRGRRWSAVGGYKKWEISNEFNFK
jgi:hypothetical protein